MVHSQESLIELGHDFDRALVSLKRLQDASIVMTRMMNRIRRQHLSQQTVNKYITDGVPLFSQAVIHQALLQGSMGFGLGSSRSLAFWYASPGRTKGIPRNDKVHWESDEESATDPSQTNPARDKLLMQLDAADNGVHAFRGWNPSVDCFLLGTLPALHLHIIFTVSYCTICI